MPETRALFYSENGKAPVKEWLEQLRNADRKGFAKCVASLRELMVCGYELRRPAADFVRDGIHELRAKNGHIQYRILYFFHGRNVVVLAHAIMKKDSEVPNTDIERALTRKRQFDVDPNRHTYETPAT